jgi:hypothetical protein
MLLKSPRPTDYPLGFSVERWPVAACYTCCGKKYHSGTRCRRKRGTICMALALMTEREVEDHVLLTHEVQRYPSSWQS